MTGPVHATLTLGGATVTLTLEADAEGAVRALLSSSNCFLDGEAPAVYQCVPQRQPARERGRITYCTWCQQPRPEDIAPDAPCPLCAARTAHVLRGDEVAELAPGTRYQWCTGPEGEAVTGACVRMLGDGHEPMPQYWYRVSA